MSKDNSNGFSNNSSNDPEEAELYESFVKKVKSRVSGLIPSSLSKWFLSDSTKPVVRLRDGDDEDEQIQQPPLKRAKLTSSTHITSYSTPGLFSPPSERPIPSLFTHDSVAGPSRVYHESYNGEDKDSDSSESTSGYSSIVKSAPKDIQSAYDVTSVIDANQLFNSSNFGHNRSLFTDRSLSPHMNPSLSSRRPSFNASTFGSPSFVDRTLTTQRIMNSPFYNGCTMYGGAATYSRPMKSKVQVKPVNESAQTVNNSATLSKTAQRILNTLEQYSTDVTKMPHPLEKKPLLAKYTGANPYVIHERNAPNIELQVPSVPNLLKMKLKQRLQDSTVAVRQIASTSRSAQDEYKTTKHTNKIKSKINSIRKKPDDEVVPKVSLPEVSLPITTLPKFDLSFPLPSATTKSATVACSEPPVKKIAFMPLEPVKFEAIKPKTGKIGSTSPVLSLDAEFKFADPLVIADNLKSIIAINDFKFSEPEIFNKLKSCDSFNLKIKNATAKILENVDAKFKPSSDTWECSTCLIRNLCDKTKCVACEMPKRTDEKRAFGSEFKISSDKWECTSCMVRNSNNDSVCVACATSRTKPIKPSFNKFKPPNAASECRTCLIRNKDELSKCVACEAPKDPKFETFKLKSDQWECSICMVRNSLDKTNCAACNMPKPGALASEKPKAVPMFVFGLFQDVKTNLAGFVPGETGDQPTQAFSCGLKSTNPEAPVQSIFGGKPVENQQVSKPVFTFGLKSSEETQKPEASKNTLEPQKLLDSAPVQAAPLFNPPQTESTLVAFGTAATTAPTSTSNIFNFTTNEKPPTEPPIFKFGAPVTSSESNPPSIFGAPAKLSFEPTPFETSKPFQTPPETQNKVLFSTPPVIKPFEPPMKPFASLPVKPFEPNPVKPFEATQSPSTKQAFEMPMKEAKPAFESQPFNSAFTQPPPFSFGASSKPTDSFSFGQNKPVENEKLVQAFNFGAPSGFGFGTSAAASADANFNMSISKVEESPFQAPKNIFGSDSMGSTQQQQSVPLQNGLFNFGSAAPKSGFNFGAPVPQFNNAQPASSAPGPFNFGAPQPVSTTGGFNFGVSAPTTFNADIKPSFNFTGGATPTFSAQPVTGGDDAPIQQRRKIRAHRRNPQR